MLKTHHWQDIQSVTLEMHRSPSLSVAICVASHFLNSKLRSDAITIGRANLDHYSPEDLEAEPVYQSSVFKDPMSDTWILSRTVVLSGLAPLHVSALYHQECSEDDSKIFDLVCENIAIASQHLPPMTDAPLKEFPMGEDSGLVVVGSDTDEFDVAPLLSIHFEIVEAVLEVQPQPPLSVGQESFQLRLVR